VDEWILNLVNAAILSVAGLLSERWVASRKKKILRDRLLKDGWKWRSFESLCRAIRENPNTTRELLIELGAHASTKRKDVWTLDEAE
jgi:hypothetical protein